MAAFWQSQMINALLICTFCQFGRAIQHEAVYILILEVTPRFTRISNSQIVIPAVKTPSCKWEISTDPNATDINLTDITIYFNCYTGSRREINVCDDYVRDDFVMMIRWLVPSFWPSCHLFDYHISYLHYSYHLSAADKKQRSQNCELCTSPPPLRYPVPVTRTQCTLFLPSCFLRSDSYPKCLNMSASCLPG